MVTLICSKLGRIALWFQVQALVSPVEKPCSTPCPVYFYETGDLTLWSHFLHLQNANGNSAYLRILKR